MTNASMKDEFLDEDDDPEADFHQAMFGDEDELEDEEEEEQEDNGKKRSRSAKKPNKRTTAKPKVTRRSTRKK